MLWLILNIWFHVLGGKTEEEVSIAHHFIDVTDRLEHKEDAGYSNTGIYRWFGWTNAIRTV